MLGAGLPPGRDHAVDRRRGELRAVGEDDDSCLGVRRERLEAAAKRCAGASLPVVAVDDAGVGLEGVCPGHDDDLVDTARADALEDERQEQSLLRRAEPARGAGREHDGRDHQPPREILMDSTTTLMVGTPAALPWPPMRSTVSNPEVTSPITA